MTSAYFLLLIFLMLRVTSATWSKPASYYQYGDVIIGGLFPLHTNIKRQDNYSLETTPTVPICVEYLFRGFRWMQAMLFAIEEINNSTTLLTNLTLGWKVYDSCDTPSRAVSQAMEIVRDSQDNTSKGNVSVVVGATGSDISIAVANILGIFDIPQISYGSTTRTLSDKNNYNSFLRTIPNDDEQATAIADLLMFFNWTWVGAIGGDDEYGRQGLAKFKQEAQSREICVEFEEYVPKNMDSRELNDLVERIEKYNATVFVLFIGGAHLDQIAVKLKEKNVMGKIWVAGDAWATSRKVLNAGGTSMHGTLGVATRGGHMEGFRKFLESVSPFSQSSNPFVAEFWEDTFNCSCKGNVCTSDVPNREKRQIKVPCTGKEKFSSVANNAYLQWTESELEKSYTAYLAVYAIAYALQNMTNCTKGSGLLKDGECPDIKSLEPWQLLAYLKKVKFKAPGVDEKFGFDANGDPNATYKLVSWVPNGTSQDHVEFVHVGNYSKEKSNRWSLNTEAIYWRDNNGTEVHETPISICSQPCQPGFYKVMLRSQCCHKCLPCPVGKYSNHSNAKECYKCDNLEMANPTRTYCVPKPEEYMRWNDAFGIAFACCSILGILLTLLSAVIYFRNRATAIVKATNVEISFLLFISLICCFSTPFMFIAKPEDWTCQGRQIAFLLSFTFCVACILVKTLRVLTAFQATMPLNSRKRSRFLGEHLQILVVILVALVQVVLCVMWLVIDPPKANIDQNPYDRVIVKCKPGSLALMICSQAYLAILALLAFVFAFRARKLPENFNEAKFITFSMLVFFIVWLSFIPAYLTTTGNMATALYCIGILASTFGILGCICFPKLYIILVTPENNTTQRVRETTVSHAFRAAAKSVIYRINSEEKVNTTTSTLEASRTTDSLGGSPMSRRRRPLTPSPCMARARKNKDSFRPRSGSAGSRPGPRLGNELSIEINGKMTSSMLSPRKISSLEPETLKSSFDVKLQVNIEHERISSEGSSLSVNDAKQEDRFIPDVEEKPVKVLQIRHRGRNSYHPVPQTDSSASDAGSVKKSTSCSDYSRKSNTEHRAVTNLEPQHLCNRLRSSSA